MIKPDELKKLVAESKNVYVLIAGSETWVKTYKGEVMFIYRSVGDRMNAVAKHGDLYIDALDDPKE